MKRQIAVNAMIIINVVLLIYQLTDKSGTVKILPMEEAYYPYSLVADNENYYFIGIEFAEDGSVLKSQICQVDNGESNPRILDIKAPDEIPFYQLFVDEKENLYIFLCNDRNERCEIWKLSPDKVITKKLDISECISKVEGYGISAFAVDNEGRYYLREYVGNGTLILDENGEKLCRIGDGDRGFHCMGARDGKIYILYNTPALSPGQFEIDSINVAEKRLDIESTGNFLPLEDIYSVLGAGERCDFLIRGMRGAYKYNLGEPKAEKIIDSFYIEQLPYNSSTSCFFKDNQLLVIAKKQHIGEGIKYGDVNFCYYAF